MITRALGAGADVEVDVEVFPARGGDLFLVCSDGLTGMVHEPQLKPLLQQDGSLERMGRSLIAAANEAGGRDNITVILFRLEDTGARAGTAGGAVTAESRAQGTEEYDTFAGEAVEPRQGVSRPSAEAGDAAEAEYRRTGTVALQALPATEGGSAAPAREPPPERTAPLPGRTRSRRRRRWRPGGGLVLLLLGLVLPLLVGALARHPRRRHLRGARPPRRLRPSPTSAVSVPSCPSGSSTSTSAGTRPA